MPQDPDTLPPQKPKSRRGGRRPGAGAPKGNLNALKHGRRSRQFAELGALLAENPAVREAILEVGRKHDMKRQREDQIALEELFKILEKANQIAADRLSAQGLPVVGPSIKLPDWAKPLVPPPPPPAFDPDFFLKL